MTFKQLQAAAKKFAALMNAMEPAEVKALLGAQAEAEKVRLGKANPGGEAPCPWRLSDELQEIRLRVPEPSHVKHEVLKYRKPTMVSGTLTKRRFCTEDGSSFDAWTADGKTPIFPIPMEGKT